MTSEETSSAATEVVFKGKGKRKQKKAAEPVAVMLPQRNHQSDSEGEVPGDDFLSAPNNNLKKGAS
jgi:hypothetical protein